jgi:hypothetical protein
MRELSKLILLSIIIKYRFSLFSILSLLFNLTASVKQLKKVIVTIIVTCIYPKNFSWNYLKRKDLHDYCLLHFKGFNVKFF